MADPVLCLVRLNPVVNYEKRHHFPDILRHDFIIIYQCPVEIIGYALERSSGKKIPLLRKKMVIEDVGNNSGIFMVFSCEKYLAPVHYRMTISKSINMSVKYYTFSYKIGIFKIITAFYIITYVITNDYFIGITGKIYVSQHIHNMT
jgi:hypothetical protein